ncbi:MAG: hypothetical protein HKN36_06690 [Hellea sp.]|nr:hypothetical protein [Hellea sp.]
MLIAAAIIIVGIGFAHSWLGETKVLIPHYKRYDLKPGTKRVIRVSWHLLTLFWVAIAAQLFSMQLYPAHMSKSFMLIMTIAFGISTFVALIASRGRHISWIGFGAATILLACTAFHP